MPSTVKEVLETKEKKEEEILSEEKGSALEAENVSLGRTRKGNFPLFYLFAPLFCVILLVFGIFLGKALRPSSAQKEPVTQEKEVIEEVERYGLPEWITPCVIALDGESRRGESLEAVRDIAVHYVANPGTGAMANRNYFDGPDSDTGAHFIVGLEGEILLCIPPHEKSSATNERNADTISVEVCHPDATGEFSPKTRESLVRLLAFLCQKYDLTENNLIRHYDVTGKMCPLFYVENPEEWERLKQDVLHKMQEGEF